MSLLDQQTPLTVTTDKKDLAGNFDAPLELTVVVPTYDERENVQVLIGKLKSALAGTAWEVVFVDDHSPDGTAEMLRGIARRDRRIRVIERIGRRGLASACIEGMMSSAAPFIAVMDADLQHDETLLPQMLEKIRGAGAGGAGAGGAGADVVVASRNIGGGSMGEFGKRREKLSHLGMRVSRMVCKCDLTDAMSGFFMIEAGFLRLQAPRLTGSGFKILVDILATSRTPPRVLEIPYHFRMRQAGESKLDTKVQLEYLFLILDKLIGDRVPTRFVIFSCVGALGLVLHLGLLRALYGTGLMSFLNAQIAATIVAMTSNFLLNNVATFRDQQLHGAALLRGLLTFYAACSLGALINVAFASLLMERGVPYLLAGVCGTAISSIWNYGANTVLTWRRRMA